MKPQDLESEMRQLSSLDAEAQLLQEVVSSRHSQTRFAREHAQYLQRGAHEVTQKLARARPQPGSEAEFERVRAAATRLEQRLVGFVRELP